jgi:AAA family ATP:ADP antiporter
LQLLIVVRAIPIRSSFCDRVLAPLGNVKRGEGARAALMILCVFLILSAYYALKTAREGLILADGTFGLRGDELKAYATGAMALMLIALVPAYGLLADHQRRIRLINISYAIVLSSLGAFYVLGRAGVPVALPFFLWFGLVCVFVVAQFWSYANDLYNEEEGVRLFGIIATGGTLGAILGPRIAKPVDTFTVMLLAGAMLVGALLLFNIIDGDARRERGPAKEPTPGPGGFSLVLADRGLMLIAGLLLVSNVVNSIGEFVLASAVRANAVEAVAGAVERRELIKTFYSDFYTWVNALTFLIQIFLVSRLLDKIGVRRALFVLPVIAFGAYAAIGLVGGLALVRAVKIAENATDYSLQNTVRQALFLRTDRAVKYKAKAAIDTFFVRVGDTLAAIIIAVGIHQLGFNGRDLAMVNLGLVVVWIAIAVGIARDQRLVVFEQDPARRGVDVVELAGAHDPGERGHGHARDQQREGQDDIERGHRDSFRKARERSELPSTVSELSGIKSAAIKG